MEFKRNEPCNLDEVEDRRNEEPIVEKPSMALLSQPDTESTTVEESRHET